MPNARNLIDKLANVPFDPERDQSLPWQSGYAGLGFNTETLKELTGKSEIRTIAELWDPALKGRVTILSEMRDTVGVVMLAQGNDPANFTEDDYNAAIAELQKQIDAGQIRQVSGNDYIAALETGDVVAAIGWSGDVAALGDPYKFVIPESGGTLWTDNMLIPAMAGTRTTPSGSWTTTTTRPSRPRSPPTCSTSARSRARRRRWPRSTPPWSRTPSSSRRRSDLENVTVFMTLTSSEQVEVRPGIPDPHRQLSPRPGGAPRWPPKPPRGSRTCTWSG